jgi:hypothetical protein
MQVFRHAPKALATVSMSPSHSEVPTHDPPTRTGLRRDLILTLVLLLAVGGASLTWYLVRVAPKSAPAAAAAPAAPAVPVTLGTSETKSVPVYLVGLGTVQAFNTVIVKVRVDGQLDKVDFTEGQDVKARDVLARIDPRPFQACAAPALLGHPHERHQGCDGDRFELPALSHI